MTLSVVLVAGRHRPQPQAVLEALALQTVPFELVIVDVHPDAVALRLPAGLEATRLERPGSTLGVARAAGALAARGDVVAFLIDHCRPAPGWAAAVLDSFEEHPACVSLGYAYEPFGGTAPARAAARSDLWRWPAGRADAAVSGLPSSDIAYPRDVLAGLGSRLPALLDCDTVLQRELAGGGQLRTAGQAIVSHPCLVGWRENCLASFDYCRRMGAQEAEAAGRAPARRLAFALAAGGSMAIRELGAMLAATPRGGWASTARLLPLITLFQLSAAAGRVTGLLFNAGDAGVRWSRAELEGVR